MTKMWTYDIDYDLVNDCFFIYCSVCGFRSYHPDDIADKCCPNCDKTHKELSNEN